MPTETSADLTLLEHLDIAPTLTAKNGWLSSDDAASTTALLYRDVALVSPGEWTQRTGETHVDGFHILGHTFPVPSDWFHDLAGVGLTVSRSCRRPVFPLRRGVDAALRFGCA